MRLIWWRIHRWETSIDCCWFGHHWSESIIMNDKSEQGFTKIIGKYWWKGML